MIQYYSLFSGIKLLMLELNICCDEACFCRLMLVRYTAAVSQDAPEVMKFAALGLVV